MDYNTEKLISELFTSEQCDIIGVSESTFDIYTKDENGKKIIDMDKVKSEFDKIKNMTEPEAQANKSKQLMHEICSCLLYFGGLAATGAAISFNLPVVAVASILVSISGFALVIKLPPASKTQYYAAYADEIQKAINNLSSIYNKIKDKNPEKAKELNKQIEDLQTTKKKLIAEVKKDTV